MNDYSYIKNPKIRRLYREVEKEARRRRKSVDYVWDMLLRMRKAEVKKCTSQRHSSSGLASESVDTKQSRN